VSCKIATTPKHILAALTMRVSMCCCMGFITWASLCCYMLHGPHHNKGLNMLLRRLRTTSHTDGRPAARAF
jgi:hypothetical protein